MEVPIDLLSLVSLSNRLGSLVDQHTCVLSIASKLNIMLQISHKMFRNMMFGYRNFDRFDMIFFFFFQNLYLALQK